MPLCAAPVVSTRHEIVPTGGTHGLHFPFAEQLPAGTKSVSPSAPRAFIALRMFRAHVYATTAAVVATATFRTNRPYSPRLPPKAPSAVVVPALPVGSAQFTGSPLAYRYLCR